MEVASGTEAVSALLAPVIIILTSIAGYVAYKLKPPEGKTHEGDVAVISASLADRKTVTTLATSMDDLNETLRETNSLLRAEAQRRHDESIIRDALKRRGIVE